MIRLIIADDQALVRDGLKMIVDLEDDLKVLALAEDGQQAINLTQKFLPDLVLMDINMPNVSGIEATRKIKAQYPSVQIMVLTTYDGGTWIQDAIDAGADGYLLKDTRREDLVRAIRGTVEGKNYIDPNVAGKIFKNIGGPGNAPEWLGSLNKRELNVLRLIGQGMSNAKISEVLFLSEGTIRNYVSSVLLKLDVQDRTQAAILAVKHGLDS